MCGRYTVVLDPAQFEAQFGVPAPPDLRPRYNLAPSQDAPVVVGDGGAGRHAEFMRWGLVPPFAENPDSGPRLINARSETVHEKPSFRSLVARHRLLVPADGFYEWKAAAGGGRKIPYRIRMKGGTPFAFAGLWAAWKKPAGGILRTFTILTTAPNDLVRTVHDRMPVILPRDRFAEWLDVSVPFDRVRPLLAPCAPGAMELYPVSARVNDVACDDPACIEPVAPPPAAQSDLFPGF